MAHGAVGLADGIQPSVHVIVHATRRCHRLAEPRLAAAERASRMASCQWENVAKKPIFHDCMACARMSDVSVDTLDCTTGSWHVFYRHVSKESAQKALYGPRAAPEPNPCLAVRKNPKSCSGTWTVGVGIPEPLAQNGGSSFRFLDYPEVDA